MEQTRPVWKSMVTGAAAATVTAMLLSIISAALISKSVIPETSTATVGMIVSLMGCLAGAIIAGRIQKGKLLITCLGSAAMYLAVLLIIKAAFFGRWDQINIPMIMGILACGFAASFVPTGKRVHHKKR